MPPIRPNPSDEMIDTGAVVVAGGRALAAAAKRVVSRLYVQLDSSKPVSELRDLVPKLYDEATTTCPNVDVRVVVNTTRTTADLGHVLSAPNLQAVQNAVLGPKPYKHVCLGGTFDRLHNGHKILLTTAVLLSDRVTLGVTTGDMIKKKTLYELMEPVSDRIAAVRDFLTEIAEGTNIGIEEITDPFGPAIVYEDLDCIVVSEETIRGGNAVNDKRRERGLNQLAVEQITLVGGPDAVLNETKLSSSSRRRQLLGELRQPVNQDPTLPASPYLVGLTGGIASGKSNIASYLIDQGCDVADCDKIVHELYATKNKFSEAIATNFGADLVGPDGKVDRKALGEVVFNDPAKRAQLTSLIWPAVADVVASRIAASSSDIFVIDAALLLEAGWKSKVREVWTTFVPHEEAIRRVNERDGLSPDDAAKRIGSQLSNEARIAQSHVVFCSLWEKTETRRQVKKALDRVRSHGDGQI